MTKIKRQVPKRRFKEFKNVGEWRQYDFKQLYEVSSGYAFNYHDYCDHGISLINGASIEHGKINKSNMNYLPKDFLSQYSNFVVKENDIVLGLNRPIINGNLKISKIPVELNNSLLYQRAGKIKYMTEINNDFSFVLLAQEILKYTLREAVGSDQPFISTSKLSNWKIIIPKEKKEQKKIGSLFKKIDKMIQVQQSKVNKIKDLKSAYLSEMFPKAGDDYPIRRFEGFHGSWETCHLGQVAGINKGEQLNKEKMIKSGKYYVLNGGINPSGYTNTYNTKEQTISISEGGNSCGYVNYNEKKFWSGGHNYALTNPKINVLYLYYFLKSRQDEIMSLRVGSGLPNIQITALSEFYISYPLRDEQEKIGQFFKNLDNQISIEEEKLTKLEKLKQAYLNDMFV